MICQVAPKVTSAPSPQIIQYARMIVDQWITICQKGTDNQESLFQFFQLFASRSEEFICLLLRIFMELCVEKNYHITVQNKVVRGRST